MDLSQRPAFLVSEFDQRNQLCQIRFSRSFSDVISGWKSSTRISPVFASSLAVANSTDPFGGSVWIVFCGPLNPATFIDLDADVSLWLTLGTFNVIAVSRKRTCAETLANQALSAGASIEMWTVVDGNVIAINYGASSSNVQALPTSLINLANLQRIPPDLHTSVGEYCTLMASSLRRAQQALPDVVPDLLAVHEFVVKAIESADLTDRTDLYRTLGILAHLNAGISRFCAQTVSGISPIHQTECHFWIHSLLGTGVANLVLHRFAAFVGSKLDRLFLPARLRQLASRTDSLVDLNKAPPDFWHGNHLETVRIPNSEREEPLVPLLTYFSGRDGFRSGLNTVSAPLASVTACNSRQWSLMTMTHEISHITIRGALTVIFPNPTSPQGTDILIAYLNKQCTDWLTALRFFLLDTVITMQYIDDQSSGAKIIRDFDERRLVALLDKWHNEVEEIMVHVFDFLYCYGQDTKRYVSSIWLTWGVIPNIANRVKEYVVRTLCTVLVKHLRREHAEDITRSEVLSILNDLCTAGTGLYVQAAHDLLADDTQWNNLRSALVARKGLVKITRGFLYWDQAAQDLRGDSTFSSDASARSGYHLKVGQLTHDLVENPLRVVEEYTDTLTPSDLTSAWLLYALAFNVRTPNRG